MLISTGFHQDLGVHHAALDAIKYIHKCIHKYQIRRNILNNSQHLAAPAQNVLVNIFEYDSKHYNVNVNIFN